MKALEMATERSHAEVAGYRQPEAPPRVEDPIHWFESRSPDIDIDSETCVSLWTGDR